MLPAIPHAASERPIHLGAVPQWYWLDTHTKTLGLILDWCDAARNRDWVPCGVRILRNWPVLMRDGTVIIAPTIIEYYKGAQ